MPISKLKHWPAFGKKRLDPKWYQTLSEVGGGEKIARTWYISLKPIPPDQFAKVEVKDDMGEWVEYAPDQTERHKED